MADLETFNRGRVKTDMHCHQCSNQFIARLNYDINGNHVIECPWCGHEHCRTIKDGVITGERWDSREQRVDVGKRNVWKANDIQIEAHTVSHFLRDRWLNHGADE